MLLEDTRVPTGVAATGAAVPNVRRPVLCGAQAAIMAFGRENGPERYTWVEELSDYQNEAGISAAAIWGVKKTVFNAADYATVLMPSYADPSLTLAG